MNIFPFRVLQGPCPPKLEQSIERTQRNGDKTEQATSIEPDRKIERARHNINASITCEIDGCGGCLEIPNLNDSVFNREITKCGFGSFVTKSPVINNR